MRRKIMKATTEGEMNKMIKEVSKGGWKPISDIKVDYGRMSPYEVLLENEGLFSYK